MLGTIITTIFGGGITGLFGTLVTSILNFMNQREKNKHEIEMSKIQIEMLKAQTDAQIKIVQAQIQGAVELQDSVAFTKSQQYGNDKVFSSSWIEKLLEIKGWTSLVAQPIAYIIVILFGIVDFLKTLMRPGITIYLMGASTWVTYQAWMILQKVEKDINVDEALGIYKSIIIIIIYLTVSCVTWWFGDRRIAKFLMRLNDGNLKPLQEDTGKN